jgi:conjugal transfer pilus assembly protein TraU
MNKIYLLLLCLTPLFLKNLQAKEGTWVNPLTDVCWECVFPITVSGVNVTKEEDFVDYSKRICICKGIPPAIGIPLTFWEPVHLVDVTRHAYKMMGLGGISIGKESVKNRGSVGLVGDGPSQSSFYHVHWYHYPLFALLSLFTDFVCVEKGDLDMGYMTELDPMWNDDQLSIIMNGEAGLFGNPMAQIACIADCAAASFGKPLDSLFWCAGCQGSLYPFTGTVAHHTGSIQASSLLVHRIIAKLHRSYLLKGFEEDEFCESTYLPVIKKSQYKTQLVYPIPQTKGPCHALGKTDLIWGMGKSYPYGGEDFVYLIWTKKQCCLSPETGGIR